VTRHQGQFRLRKITVNDVQVGPAYCAGMHAKQHLATCWRWYLTRSKS